MWFCIETVYTRASTLLSWVALWAPGFVCASVWARTGGCGSGSSLTCRAIPVAVNAIIFLDACHLIFSMFPTDVFNSKIIHY
jgi:hypothetical protein